MSQPPGVGRPAASGAARDSDPEALLTVAVAACVRAGQLARRGQARAAGTVTTKSTPTDVVTEMDRRAEEAIRHTILSARPDDGIVGEEGGERTGVSGVRWHVDPIDGTVNYMYGLPNYAVCVAAERLPNGPTYGPDPVAALLDGVVAAAVFAPSLNVMYTAVRGQGASRNGEPLGVSKKSDLGLAMVATGFGYARELRAFQGAVVAQLLPQVRDIRRFGSAALDLCLVAEGLVDGYVEQGLHSWDLAAGGLVAKEAGARIGGAEAPVGGTAVVAGGPQVYERLQAVLPSAFAAAAAESRM